MKIRSYKVNEYITKYSFGEPIETYAVVMEGKETVKNDMELLEVQETDKLCFRYQMKSDDIVLGLGENQRGINKRGGLYHSYCTDDPLHTPDKRSLYGAHNFIVVDGEEPFGVFIDFPGRASFDIGFSHKDKLEITLEGQDADVYIIKDKDLKSIVRGFLRLIGQSYAPPKWAFGYQQSRWGYFNASDVETVAEGFLKHDIPCDAIYLDIDYMEAFKDFTVNKERFPNFGQFVDKMKKKGFRLVPIIDAGVKIEKEYDIYEEGVQKSYFCVDQKGEPFVAAVWPGKVHFPDFLNSDAQKWFGSKYKLLIDQGIEGFWNDMNEPAIFYSEKRLKEAVEVAKSAADENLDINGYFKLVGTFNGLSNSPEDYNSFYHNMDGRKVVHHKVHNLYGFYMTKSAAEGFREIEPDKRFLLFSRASYIGMHRYSGIWTGDNSSWWEHILLNLKMMPSVNMCGFLYSGADTGGFGGNANAQLLIRWMQLSLFTPLFRNHAAAGTRNQEPFAFDEETTGILRNIIKLRYSLIPYIYSEYMKALHSYDMYIKALAFEYHDEISRRVENQLLVGDSLMICPIYEENAAGRYVWLPEDMLLLKYGSSGEKSFSIAKKGHMYLEAGLEEIPVFIRKNRMLIMGRSASNVDSLAGDELFVTAYVEDKASCRYYDDDGSTLEYQRGGYSEILIDIMKEAEDFKIDIKNNGNDRVKRISFEIAASDGSIVKKTLKLD